MCDTKTDKKEATADTQYTIIFVRIHFGEMRFQLRPGVIWIISYHLVQVVSSNLSFLRSSAEKRMNKCHRIKCKYTQIICTFSPRTISKLEKLCTYSFQIPALPIRDADTRGRRLHLQFTEFAQLIAERNVSCSRWSVKSFHVEISFVLCQLFVTINKASNIIIPLDYIPIFLYFRLHVGLQRRMRWKCWKFCF